MLVYCPFCVRKPPPPIPSRAYVRKSEQVFMPAARRCKLNKKFGHPWKLSWKRLSTALHYDGEVHRSWIPGEFWNLISREQHSCPMIDLHYGQEVFGREHCTRWKNDMDANVATLFLKGSSLEVKFLGQPQSLRQETWPPENSNLNKIFYCLFIFSIIHPLPQITMS